MGSLPVPPMVSSFITCSYLARHVINPDSSDAQNFWAMLAPFGVKEPIKCSTRFIELCVMAATGDPSATCDRFGELLVSDLCCESCSGVARETYHFGTNPWHDAGEAQAFVEVLEALGVVDFLPDGSKDLCMWEFIACEASGYGFWLTVPMAPDLILSPTVGKLKHLERLTVSGPIVGSIPPELGDCTRLRTISISFTNMTGTLPASLARLSDLQTLFIVGNHMTGELDKYLFASWSRITSITISSSFLVGDLPILNLKSTPKLAMVDVSVNRFSGVAGVIEPDPLTDFPGVSLKLSSNKIAAFPETLRWFRGLVSLDLSWNGLSSIPSWGYYSNDQKFLEMTHTIQYTPGEPMFCLWKLWNISDLAPPRWPDLRHADLSNNPVGASVHQFVVLFGSAPSLAQLSCEGCGLHGTVEQTFELELWLDEQETSVAGRDCTLERAFPSLVSLSVADNPDIDGCDIIDAGDWVKDSFRSRIRCNKCPLYQRVPSDLPTPLQTAKDCECLTSFVALFAGGGKECGCPDGDFLDLGEQRCAECPGSLSCRWQSELEASRSAPTLKKGYWMPCLDGKNFSSAGLYSCFSMRTCVGGAVTATSCSSTSLCASGRTGRACSACLPGYFGGPDGTCSLCDLTPEETRQVMAIAAVLAVPVLIVCMSLLGSSQSQTSEAPPPAPPPPAALPPAEATGTAEGADDGTPIPTTSSVLAKTTSSISRAMTWTSEPEAMKLRVMFSQVFKYLQLMATVGTMSVDWEEDSAEGFAFAGKFGVDFARSLHVGCLSREWSTESSLLAQWVIPMAVIILMMLGALLSQLLSKCPMRWIKTFVVDRQLFSTFLYVLWSSFLPGLMKNALEIFTCVSNPNGELTVASRRDITCLEGSWWFLAAGGCIAFIVYVVLFFLVSILALRQVAKTLTASDLKNKGEFEFIVRCLRVSELDHNLRSAVRDVIYNLVVAIFAGMGITQLLLSAGIFVFFALNVYDRQPFEHGSLNFIDSFCSVSIAVLMLLSATLVHFSPDDAFFEARARGVFALLVITFSVPLLIFAFDIALLLPAVRRLIPERLQPLTMAVVQERRASLRDAEQMDLWEYVARLDTIEFRRFAKLIYRSDVSDLGRDGRASRDSGSRLSINVLGAAGGELSSPAARTRGSRLSGGSMSSGGRSSTSTGGRSSTGTPQQRTSLGQYSASLGQNSSAIASNTAEVDGNTEDKSPNERQVVM